MAGRTYSKAAAEAIKGALAETKVTYSFNEIEGGSRGVFLAVIALNSRLQKTKYIIDVKNDSYIVYAVLPITADASDKRKMLNLADFICRLNHRLAAGNFERVKRTVGKFATLPKSETTPAVKPAEKPSLTL